MRIALCLILTVVALARPSLSTVRPNSILEGDVSRRVTAGDLLSVLRPAFSEALVRADRFDALVRTAGHLPLYPAAGVVVEVRGLDSASSGDPRSDQVDFSIASRVSEGKSEEDEDTGLEDMDVEDGVTTRDTIVDFLSESSDALLSLRDARAARDALVSGSDTWKRVAAAIGGFAESKEKRAAAGKVWEDIWFEFDVPVDADGSATPVPSVFLGPALMSPDGGSGAGAKKWKQSVRRFLLELTKMQKKFTGEPLARPLFAKVLSVLEAIPSEGELHQVGLWLARGEDTGKVVRVIVMLPEAPAVANVPVAMTFLKDIGYKHITVVEPKVKAAARFVDDIIIAMDVSGESTGDKIGFECFVQRRKGKMYIWQRIVAFTAWLVEQGMVSEARAQGIRRFIGFDKYAGIDRGVSTYKFPPNAEPVEQFDAKISRTVNHIKLIYDPTDGWSAKFYLWITEVPIVKQPSEDPEGFLSQGYDAVTNGGTELVI